LYQLLVGSVVIDVEFGKKNHSSIPTIAIVRDWNNLMSELTSEADYAV
jgi:hypothetical protein